MLRLGVNVDHVATLRQARYRGVKSVHIEPDPIKAARICLKAGADSIVMHLREDRRHIQDSDLQKAVRAFGRKKLNLEMSAANEIVKAAVKIRPYQATLVPEKRKELTTEGGLDVFKFFNRIKPAADKLNSKGIRVSLFIDPSKRQIIASKKIGAEYIELHTGRYSEARNQKEKSKFLKELIEAVGFAKSLGLGVNAGHGLTYENVRAVAKISGVEELNIGHSIISRAVLVGMDKAVRDMIKLMK